MTDIIHSWSVATILTSLLNTDQLSKSLTYYSWLMSQNYLNNRTRTEIIVVELELELKLGE